MNAGFVVAPLIFLFSRVTLVPPISVSSNFPFASLFSIRIPDKGNWEMGSRLKAPA